MRVLLSAYACEPGKGSEPEVGFRTLLAAAAHHEVWVLTRQNNLVSIRDAVRDTRWEHRIHPVGFEAGRGPLWAKQRGLLPVQAYYDLWQREAGKVAESLHADVHFDIAHHITFASYWARIGLLSLPIPRVLGPLGGGVDSPPGFEAVLGRRGLAAERRRRTARWVSIQMHPIEDDERSLVLVQNQETAKRIDVPSRVVSNATVVAVDAAPDQPSSRDPIIAVVGRLIPWKAGILAVRVLASLADQDARLVFFGTGPERLRIWNEAQNLSVADRVEFAGHTPRRLLLDSIARASVVLHPALREEAGLAVAESLSLGTPVVFLDHGGPPVVRSAWPSSPAAGVAPTTPDRTVQELAQAVDGYLSSPVPIRREPIRPVRPLGEAIMQAYDEAAG